MEHTTNTALNRAFTLRGFGFACIRAWIYLLFLDSTSSLLTATTGNNQASFLIYFFSCVGLISTLFICAIARRVRGSSVHGKRARYVAPLLASAGSVLLMATAAKTGNLEVIATLGSILTGVGSGLIMLDYGKLYRSEQTERTNSEVPLAFLLAAVIFAATIALPRPIAFSICSLLPLASGCILILRLHDDEPDSNDTFQIEIGNFAVRIGICACLVGISDGMARVAAFSSSGLSSLAFYQIPLPVSAVLSVAIIALCRTLAREGSGLENVYRIAVFIMTAFYILLPVSLLWPEFGSMVTLLGYGMFNILIFLLLTELAHQYWLSADIVYGIGWGMVSLGVIVGAMAGQALYSLLAFSDQLLNIVSSLSAFTIFISYLFVLKESSIEKIIAINDDPNVTGIEAHAEEVQDSGSEVLELPAEDSGEDQQTSTDQLPHRMRFMVACDAVAQDAGLTPREKEIMILYAKGRTSVSIQEELFLSRGTVTTHLSHIFQKTAVHSKQELMDLIEGYRDQV